jgi:murein DD-endopeptidase MepM/ murein hydrolase activator NlpD
MAMANVHRKIFQVEHENVSVKAAHRAEMTAELGVRTALRHHKTAPYRKVAKLEKAAAKKTIKLNYHASRQAGQKALAEKPKLKSNMLSRMWQKRKIKKDYAKKARQAKKAAGAAKKAGNVTGRAAAALGKVIVKNPKVMIILALLILILLMVMPLFTMCSSIGGGSFSGILTASYLAEDDEIDSAALTYSEWETDLRFRIANTESEYPGYDEYIYDIGTIYHNPYELMAYLTAVYHEFTYDAVAGDLQALFDEQYTLTFTETIEIRYADPPDEDSEPVPYEWKILTVTLTVKPLSEILLENMNTEQLQHYAVLTMTSGSKQYAGSPFSINWLPYVTSSYGWRVHPISGAKDLHRGVDIALPEGTEILSAQNGTVTFAGYSGSYGNVVVIENDDGLTTKYAHCDSLLVSEGQTVSMGDIIATVGSTGSSTGPHLHFEVLINGEYRNPLFFSHTGG